jgi:hypothetical protein
MEYIPMCAQMQRAVSEGVDVIRDMDVVRDILRIVEQSPEFNNKSDMLFPIADLGLGEDRVEEIEYDLTLLVEQGYLHGSVDGINSPVIRGLTWNGHELIADITSPDIWAIVKERIKGMGNVGIAFMWEIAKIEIRKKLGLPAQ